MQSASSNTATTTPDTPPVIQINGSNPAAIHAGDTYADLGATAVDHAGTSLSVHTFLNGIGMSEIIIDTGQVATDTIDYVATDSTGLMSTSTRTVLIEVAAIPTPASEPASSTEATSTAR